MKFLSLFRKRKEPSQGEIVEAFQNSFESDNVVDMAIDVTDITIDKFIESDFINDIPVVNILNGAYKIYKNVQSYRLAKKVFLFLYHTNDIEVDKKKEFVKEFIESNQEEGVDVLLSVIDQLDNQNKVVIMTRLLKARIDNNISIQDFNRLVSCLQRIPYSDLNKMPDYLERHYEAGITEVLFAAGVLYDCFEDFDDGNDMYKLNRNGILLIKYGLYIDIPVPESYPIERPSVIVADESMIYDQN